MGDWFLNKCKLFVVYFIYNRSMGLYKAKLIFYFLLCLLHNKFRVIIILKDKGWHCTEEKINKYFYAYNK